MLCFNSMIFPASGGLWASIVLSFHLDFFFSWAVFSFDVPCWFNVTHHSLRILLVAMNGGVFGGGERCLGVFGFALFSV